jgi:hypothetical protein
MNKPMQAHSELKFIFHNVNEWLKFAEAKHAGLVVFNAAIIVGISSSYTTIRHFVYPSMILVGAICLGISIFISIISQFPVTGNFLSSNARSQNPNLYFFGDLANCNVQTVIDKFKAIDSSFDLSQLDGNLINQILVNARITESKFKLFKFASYITALGCGLIGFSTIIKIICPF